MPNEVTTPGLKNAWRSGRFPCGTVRPLAPTRSMSSSSIEWPTRNATAAKALLIDGLTLAL